MATKGKTRGPKESKYANKGEKDTPKHATRRKRTSVVAGSRRQQTRRPKTEI